MKTHLKHPLQYRESAFSLVIITNSMEYTYLLTVHSECIIQHSASKGAVFAIGGKVACFPHVSLLFLFALLSARVFLFIATNPSELFLAQLKAFYLESIIRILNGIKYT